MRAIVANDPADNGGAASVCKISLCACVLPAGRRQTQRLLATIMGTLAWLRFGSGRGAVILFVLGALLAAGCGSSHHHASTRSSTPSGTTRPGPAPDRDTPVNVYSADAAGDVSPVVRNDPALVYVPNSLSNTVDEISQRTLKTLPSFPVGELPQHVTPRTTCRRCTWTTTSATP